MDDDDKLLDHDDLRALGIRYCRAQLWRLYKDGKFPAPVRLSKSRNAWLSSEIKAWLSARIAERDGRPA
jgi:predicted DNA-binding transcriptional regulator AlpA